MAKPIKVGDKWRVQFRRKGQPSVSRYFDKKSHADAYSRQIDHELRAGEYNSTKEFTNTIVEDILVRYEAEVTKTKEMGRSKLHCLKTLRTHLGSAFINKLNSETVIDYANKRQNMGAGGVTINIELTYLKGALKIAKLLWKIPIKTDPVADARVALKHLGKV